MNIKIIFDTKWFKKDEHGGIGVYTQRREISNALEVVTF